jgi:hypothetical protein
MFFQRKKEGKKHNFFVILKDFFAQKKNPAHLNMYVYMYICICVMYVCMYVF